MKSLTDIVAIFTAPRRTRVRMPFKRLVKYYRHRIGRLPGTPYQIAAGFANGMAVSMTPFLGLHIVMGIIVCLIVRASPVAMIIGSIIGGNPWTFPFIWVGSYELGQWLLARQGDSSSVENLRLADLLHNPVDLLWPMTVGSLPLAFGVWLVSYGLLFLIVRKRQHERRQRHAARSAS